MTDKWQEDPFKKLDEIGLKGEVSPIVRKAYEAKIAEAPEREALMNEVLLRSTPSEDRERKLQRTLTNIHTVAKHILNLTDERAKDLFVGVRPRGSGSGWHVEVRYAMFVRDTKAPEISEALNKMLSLLTSYLIKRLDEGARIVEAMSPTAASRSTSTKDGIADAVNQVPGVDGVIVHDTDAVGIVHITIMKKGSLAGDEHDQIIAEAGAALGKSLATSVRFRIKVLLV